MIPFARQADPETHPRKLDLNPWHPDIVIGQYPRTMGATSASAALVDYVLKHFAHDELNVLELGSGSGVISILLALSRKSWRITGIDIQAELVDLAENNARVLNPKPEFRQADLRSFDASCSYELVLSNPPWQKLHSGLQSPNKMRAISRMEICCTLPDMISCCTRNLKTGGHAVLMYPSLRRTELLTAAEKNGLSLASTCANSDHWTIFHLIKG